MSRARELADAGSKANFLDNVSADINTTYAPLASPTFTGTVSGVTATHVGLGNVTNESKATMFDSPTFTNSATIPYIQGIGNFFGTYFNFSGGGTQNIFTPSAGTIYMFMSSPRNYGGSDDRHGDVAFVSVPRSGVGSITVVHGGSGSGAWNISASTVQYSAGGGNPATSLFYIRIA